MATAVDSLPASSLPAASLTPLPGYVCACIGGVSGTIEVLVNQPTVSMKNRLQQGLAISLNPAILYRGTFVNAVSIAPITAIQFGVSGLLTSWLSAGRSAPLSDVESLGVSAFGGAVSALVVCPSDAVMIAQQRSGRSLISEYRHIATTVGVNRLSVGLAPAIIREALFTAGYLGLAPILRRTLVSAYPQTFASADSKGNVVSLVGSSMAAGIIAGVLTHPIDTIKTRMQSDLATSSPYQTMRAAAAAVWANGGLMRFYDGVIPRTTRICVAVLIFNQCNSVFSAAARSFGF